MRTLTCQCEASFGADLPSEIDLDCEKTSLGEILAGTFMTVECPNCGRSLKPELEFRFRSSRQGLDILVVPEAARFSVYSGIVKAPAASEILIGYAELYERALMLSSSLDPRCIEILKYHLLAKAISTAGSAEEILVLFAGRQEDGKLKFHIQGLKPEEIAVIALSFDHYEKACANLGQIAGTEPFSRFLPGPYRSIRALEIPGDS
ncbi:MAG: CpXC domain-containing protein [Spirochaetota bacterium]